MVSSTSRVNGVGELQIFGAQYAMRVWVDPLKLNSYQLTITDVINAVTAQNAQVSAGAIGDLPNVAGQGIIQVVTPPKPKTEKQTFISGTLDDPNWFPPPPPELLVMSAYL